MNKEFVITEDKAVISNEDGNLRESENYDNIIEILEQENVIEGIEYKIKTLIDLKNNMNYEKGEVKKHSKFFIVPIILLLLIEVGFRYGLKADLYMDETFLGLISRPVYFAIIYGFAGTIVSTIIGLIQRYHNKQTDKRKQGLQESVNYLQKKLEEEKEKLDKLNNEKKKVTGPKSKITLMRLHDPSILKDLFNQAYVYFNFTSNPEKYYNNYLRGSLHLLLERENDLRNIDNYIDVIEEKGPQLIKDFRHSDNY